jgi:hypothetical protein
LAPCEQQHAAGRERDHDAGTGKNRPSIIDGASTGRMLQVPARTSRRVLPRAIVVSVRNPAITDLRAESV